jgi:hypothetical protein
MMGEPGMVMEAALEAFAMVLAQLLSTQETGPDNHANKRAAHGMDLVVILTMS